MRLMIFSTYFWRHQVGEFSPLYLLLVFALGYTATLMVFKLKATNIGRWRIALPIVAMASPFIGLIFASTTYYCPICSAKPFQAGTIQVDWCEVAIVGMPFPSRFFGIDLANVGPRTRMTD